MRNATVTLTDLAALVAEAAEHNIMAAGERVALTYVKADGTESAATGNFVRFMGEPGTNKRSVSLDTERGFRTISLHNVMTVESL